MRFLANLTGALALFAALATALIVVHGLTRDHDAHTGDRVSGTYATPITRP